MIYFIQDGTGPVKIGRAYSLPLRLADLPEAQGVRPETLTVLAIMMEGNDYEERMLHTEFKADRVSHGNGRGREWFRPTDKLLNHINVLHEDPAYGRQWLLSINAYAYSSDPTPSELKAWRQELRLTQVQAAAWFNVPRGTYGRWERGQSLPNWGAKRDMNSARARFES